MSKHSFAEDLDKALESIKKEEHERRVKNLRKELDFLASTDWQFQDKEGMPWQ